jgi:hypothetical protein
MTILQWLACFTNHFSSFGGIQIFFVNVKLLLLCLI